jgi:transcriptional regulator with XRE-family HTH domain
MNEHKVDIAAQFEGEGQRQSRVMIPAPSQGAALNRVTQSMADGYIAAWEELGEKTPLRHDLTGQSVAAAEVYAARGPRMTPTPSQCRGARGLLDWTQAELAIHTGFGLNTIGEYERGRPAYADTVYRLRDTFEAAGISFPEHGVIGPPEEPVAVRQRSPSFQHRPMQTEKMYTIVAAYRSGLTLKAIAQQEGVSRERIRQRIAKYEELTGETIIRHRGKSAKPLMDE